MITRLVIDGVDYTKWIAQGGYKVTRSDGDGENAGRSQDYYMWRDRIATKYRLDIQLRDLWDNDAITAMSGLLPEYVTVQYANPFTGRLETMEAYSNNNVATLIMGIAGRQLWGFDSFFLTER